MIRNGTVGAVRCEMVRKERCGRNVAIRCSTVRWIHCGKVRCGLVFMVSLCAYGAIQFGECEVISLTYCKYDAIPSGEYLAMRCGKKTQFEICAISWLQLDLSIF